MQIVSNMLKLLHTALTKKLHEADTVVDATAGNGNDTLFFAENTKETAHIYAMDIQSQAIENTRKLTADLCDKITYICDSHVKLTEYVKDEIDIAMFNLGYLPKGVHGLTTRADTTKPALKAALSRLSLHGVLAIAVYPGHAEGKREAEMISLWVKELPNRLYTAGCYRLMNHVETAPYFYLIERTK